MTTKQIIKELSKVYNVTVTFKDIYPGGRVDCKQRKITITNKRKSKEWILSVMMHEICHVICYDGDIFKNYHKTKTKRSALFLALRAERYVDKRGGELMKFYFPNLKYHYSYSRADAGPWLREYYENCRWR